MSPSGGENYDYNCLVALGVHPTFVHFPLEIQLSVDRQPYVFMMHPRYTHALIYHFTSHSSRSESSIRVFISFIVNYFNFSFPGSSILISDHLFRNIGDEKHLFESGQLNSKKIQLIYHK